MYRKPTFMREENTIATENISGRQILRADDMSGTHLILHDDGSSIYQSFDINMPYLINL